MNAIQSAYATYDSDKRVNGPDDFEAFRDAVEPIIASFHTSLADFQQETERLRAENEQLKEELKDRINGRGVYLKPVPPSPR